MIGWPSCGESCSNTMRGTTSVALPAPNGMTARIVRDGQLADMVSAKAMPGTTANAIAAPNRRSRMVPSPKTSDPFVPAPG